MKRIHALAAIVLLLGLSSCLSTIHPIFTEKDLVFDQKLIGTWGYQKKVEGDSAEMVDMATKERNKPSEVRNASGKRFYVLQGKSGEPIQVEVDGVVEFSKATSADFSEVPQLKKLLGKTYMVRHKDGDGNVQAAYFGFLVKLGNNYYLDYYPAETPAISSYSDFYKSFYTKMHTAYRVNFTGNNSFELKQFDETFMKNLIDNKKIRIRHETREDGSFIVTASTEELQQYILKYSEVPEAYYSDNTSMYTRILNH
jgi:hypothetical protein